MSKVAAMMKPMMRPFPKGEPGMQSQVAEIPTLPALPVGMHWEALTFIDNNGVARTVTALVSDVSA